MLWILLIAYVVMCYIWGAYVVVRLVVNDSERRARRGDVQAEPTVFCVQQRRAA